MVNKVSTGVLKGKSMWVLKEIFQQYRLELVKATLSQCYKEVNSMVKYSVVEVDLHTFSARPLNLDLLLTSISVRFYQLKIPQAIF